MKKRLLELVLSVLVLSFLRIEPTNAFFTDQAVSFGNTVSTGFWVSTGDVVINELMWMGSYDKNQADLTDGNDEWLELRNMTGRPINLNGWRLTALVGEEKREETMITFDSREIPANGFFLIAKLTKEDSSINVEPDWVYSGLTLRNSDLQLKLYDARGNLIDTADDGSGNPLAGAKGALWHSSMQRVTPPGDGTLKESWFTGIDHSEETKAYWDEGAEDRGTPGGRNL